MTRTIKAHEVIDAIRDEVRRRGGDFVYNGRYTSCVYQERNPEHGGVTLTGNPGCIVGGALMLSLGLSFTRKGGGLIEGIFSTVQNQVEELNDVKFTPRAALLLTVAQAVQDNGGSHGLALNTADRMSQAMYRSDIVLDEVTA